MFSGLLFMIKNTFFDIKLIVLKTLLVKFNILIYLFKLFYCCSITVVCIPPPTAPPPPQPNPPPSLASTLPLGFAHVSFIVVPENPFPHYLLLPPLRLLSDCSYFQCLWLYDLTFNENIINKRKKQAKY